MPSYRDPDELFNELAITAGSGASPIGVLARYVFLKTDDGKRYLLTGCWEHCVNPVKARDPLEYDPLLFFDEWIPMAERESQLRRLLAGQLRPLGYEISNRIKLEGDGTRRFSSTKDFHGYFHPSSGSYSGWAESRCLLQLDPSSENMGVSDHPLIRFGSDPIPSAVRAASDWVWGPLYRLRQSEKVLNAGRLGFVRPSFSARIRRATWNHLHVDVEIEISDSSQTFELQWNLKGRSEVSPGRVPVSKTSHTFKVPHGLEAVELILVDSNHNVLSYLQLSEGRESFDSDAPVFKEENRALRELSEGENQVVEYKPFVWQLKDRQQPSGLSDDVGKRERAEKIAELTQVATAFANQREGRIYVGVSNSGRPQGRSELIKCVLGDTSDPEGKMIERLRTYLQDQILPQPQYRIQMIEVGGEPVIVIDFQDTAVGPYKHKKDNQVYIRRNASVGPWDPVLEKDYFSGQRVQLDMLGMPTLRYSQLV